MHLPKVEKPKTVKRLGPVKIDALLDRVSQLSEKAWMAEDATKENKFDVFHHTQHIIFRFIPGNRDAAEHYERPAWRIWAPLVQPILDDATRPYGFLDPVFPKVMLARLKAGHQIDMHTDGAGSNLQVHKIHVPLITNPGAILCVDKAEEHLELGWAYEVNNITRHGVRNTGADDRVHLIFEVYDKPSAGT